MKLPTKTALIAYLGDLALILGPLAALPYTMGDIADVLPPKAKAIMAVFCAAAAFVLKIVQRILERHQGKRDELGIDTAITIAKEAAGVPQPVSKFASDGPHEYNPITQVWSKPKSCDKAPAGWACTRAKGHDGPCAAVKLALLVFCCFLFSGCATKVNYPNGSTALWTTSDSTLISFKSKTLSFVIRGHRPSFTIQKAGAAATQIVGAAGAAAIVPGL